MAIRRSFMMLVVLLGTAVASEAQQTDMLFTLQTGPVAASPVGVIEAVPLEPVTSVPNAAFSAEAETEFTQVLGDGNRIERRIVEPREKAPPELVFRELHALRAGDDAGLLHGALPGCGHVHLLEGARTARVAVEDGRVQARGGETDAGGLAGRQRCTETGASGVRPTEELSAC